MASTSVNIRDTHITSISVYKYQYNNLKNNFIPIIIYHMDETIEFFKQWSDYTLTDPTTHEMISYPLWSTYKFNNIAAGWQYRSGIGESAGLKQGVISSFETDKIKVSSRETADSYSVSITGTVNNTILCTISTYHSTEIGLNFFAHLYIVCLEDSNGVIFAVSGGSLREPHSDVLYDIKMPSGTSMGTVTDSALSLYSYSTEEIPYDLQKGIDVKNIIKDLTPYDVDDPNGGGGDSTPSGGGGPSDIGGDTNSDDGLPTISALDSGLLTAYNPTVGELQSLGKFLWSDSFDVNSFKKLFNDPFDTLLGLSIVPIKPTTSGSKNIMFGNMDSGVSAPVVSNQWVTKDLGSVTLNEVWKGALDYSPSTSASIYLPFIGMRQLNINDVMGSTLHLIYKFDVLTGGCVAQIYVNHNHIGNKDGGFSWTTNQGLLYEFMGQCSVNIPLASQDFTNTIRSAVSAVGMVAGTSASIATGNPVLGVATATMASANLGMQANTPTVERSGHLSGSCSILGYYQPFLVVTRPHQCKPSRYYALRGIPSQVYTSKLSNCTGYTQITANNNIHISGAEDSELAEIQNLLVSGVYFPDKKR